MIQDSWRPKTDWRAVIICSFLVLVVGTVISFAQESGPAGDSFPQLLAKAQAGDANAQAEIGLAYLGGVGAPHDLSQGIA